jgi:hypothetical protein
LLAIYEAVDVFPAVMNTAPCPEDLCERARIKRQTAAKARYLAPTQGEFDRDRLVAIAEVLEQEPQPGG